LTTLKDFLIHRNKDFDFRFWTILFNENLVNWNNSNNIRKCHNILKSDDDETKIILTTKVKKKEKKNKK